MPSALKNHLEAALSSRDKRLIRRRLPDPNLHISSATTTSSDSPSGTTHSDSGSKKTIDFTSNDYLSLSLSPTLRARFLHKLSNAPDILGTGGSRLLVNTPCHNAFEERMRRFFGAEQALLFNSGFDANVGFFSCIPQTGDAIVYDEYIHASVHDGMRASRVPKGMRRAFKHDDMRDLRGVLTELSLTHAGARRHPFAEGASSVFVSVESLYSMDGTFAPLLQITRMLEELFPRGNAYLLVDEAHATGIYGSQGRGRVAELGLGNHPRILARLVTFGKALAATGAVILTSELVRDYLLNYARSLIYTTTLSFANVIAADASFDMLEDGTAERSSNDLLNLSSYFTSTLQSELARSGIPPSLASLPSHLSRASSSSSSSGGLRGDPPSPIIPLLTPHPRPLSAHLLKLGINARPITWPTVPKGKDRVRVCLHAGNTREEVDALVRGVVGWAREWMGRREGGSADTAVSAADAVSADAGRGGSGRVVLANSKL